MKFKEGISKEDLIIERTVSYGRNLLISIKDTKDQITVYNMFLDNDSEGLFNRSGLINKLEFSDGSFLSAEDIKNMMLNSGSDKDTVMHGFYTDDVISGGSGNDTVYAKSGNDTLHGNKGDDALYGGAGNDILYGGEGNDGLYGSDGDDILDGGVGN
ncbi:hemolysin-type calcium-binding domain-containing protein, partial [Campylobacter showae CC57C]